MNALAETRVPISGRLFWPFAKRFIAGTTVEQAVKVVAKYHEDGFLTTMDMLGEDVTTPEISVNAKNQYLKMLDQLSSRRLDTNVSVKLSQIGLNIDIDLCIKNLTEIAKRAANLGGFVRVDMEGSDVTSKTLDVVKNCFRKKIASWCRCSNNVKKNSKRCCKAR